VMLTIASWAESWIVNEDALVASPTH
jgi:hypothetical protein